MQETRVCSRHFKPDHDANRNNPPKASAKSGAVPCVFVREETRDETLRTSSWEATRSIDQIEERKFPSLGKKGTKYYMQFAKFHI